jgi:uncharacterized protein GlcG (DUF336 family)/3-keto-L-gulonate-6-phosphate decarboxylase
MHDQPRLWIAYDYTDIPECLNMLDRVLCDHPDADIIHEIGRPTFIRAGLDGVAVVEEFRKRLVNGQTLVADLKGYDVPYSAEGKDCYDAGADLVTVMAAAPDEAITEAIEGARVSRKLVAFDTMGYADDVTKARRARELASLGAGLISCHTGWSEQASGKTPIALIDKVCEQIKGTPAKVVAMGGLKPDDVSKLAKHIRAGSIFAIVAGSAITRSGDPAAVIDRFKRELAKVAASTDPGAASVRCPGLDDVTRRIAAGVAHAAKIGVAMNIAIVDPGGHLISFSRMDGAWLGSVDIAVKKAKTSVLFKMPSSVIGELSQPGEPLYGIEISNDGLISFGGGLPITDTAGRVVAGVGVSGGTVGQDVLVAQACVNA